MHDGTTILFGLPGVAVREVNLGADGARTVHVVTADPSAAACPVCGVLSTLRAWRTIVGIPDQNRGSGFGRRRVRADTDRDPGRGFHAMQSADPAPTWHNDRTGQPVLRSLVDPHDNSGSTGGEARLGGRTTTDAFESII